MFRVLFHPDFVPEWKLLEPGLKETVGEILDALEDEGPALGRPSVDTLQGPLFANMKEIRVRFRGQVWRFAFAFDPTQNAVVLCGGAKQGVGQVRFYRSLIAKADGRFAHWLKELRK